MQNNVESELELYEPMKAWLHKYLSNKYKKRKVFTIDAHSERLDKVLNKYGVFNEQANGIDIQIDVLGIVKDINNVKLFFIEAKRTSLTLRDLGQLWAYCKLIDPKEAFLFSSADLGSLNKLLNTYNREDLLDFGNGKYIKKMRVGIWSLTSNAPDMLTILPKL